VGASTESWEKAASAAVERAAETLRDLRGTEIVEQDISVSEGQVKFYRVKLKLSFKYEAGD
jgi:dodecin